MGNNELKIDDEYCRAMGRYFSDQGVQIDHHIALYIEVLEKVQRSAITSGSTYEALSAYLEQAKKLRGQIEPISVLAKKYAENFVTEIDEADQYLF